MECPAQGDICRASPACMSVLGDRDSSEKTLKPFLSHPRAGSERPAALPGRRFPGEVALANQTNKRCCGKLLSQDWGNHVKSQKKKPWWGGEGIREQVAAESCEISCKTARVATQLEKHSRCGLGGRHRRWPRPATQTPLGSAWAGAQWGEQGRSWALAPCWGSCCPFAVPLMSPWFLLSVPLLPLRCRAVAPRRWDAPRCWKRFQLLLDVMCAAALSSWANVAADEIDAFCESDQAACRCRSV